MRPSMNEPVSVLSGYSQKSKQFTPLILTWNNVDYRLGKIDFYHKTKQGAVTLHHFSLSTKDEAAYFKLTLDALTLHWVLDEYMMGGSVGLSD